LYVLKCLENGMTKEQIAVLFDNDSQLVNIWIDFLIDNRWIIPDMPNGRWIVTEKGRETTARYWQN
jgi:hypothetical protein